MAGKPKGSERPLKPHEQALRQLQEHYLLGPVVHRMYFLPVVKESRYQLPSGAYCQIEVNGKV